MGRDAVMLLCFPPYDEVFAYVARTRLDALPSATPDALQAVLRTTFPGAVVRPREALASLGHGSAWYVYRDGRYSPFGEDAAWWDQPGVARLELDLEGRYTGANDAALRLIGLDLPSLLEHRSGDLTDEATRPTVPWVWRLLEETGELHSTSTIVTPAGRRIPVEYRMLVECERVLVYLREVPGSAVAATDDAEPPEADVPPA